jgi:hypothetical protein
MTFRYLKFPRRWSAVLAPFFIVGSVSSSTFYGSCIFKLGDKLKVNIFLETHYMLEGSGCDKVREYLLTSMHETWSADEPSNQRATIPSITLDLLVKEGDKDQVAVHLPIFPEMFKRGEAGYVQFRDLVRAVGKPGRPGAPRYEEGWEIE